MYVPQNRHSATFAYIAMSIKYFSILATLGLSQTTPRWHFISAYIMRIIITPLLDWTSSSLIMATWDGENQDVKLMTLYLSFLGLMHLLSLGERMMTSIG